MNKNFISKHKWRGMVRDFEGRFKKYKGLRSSISGTIYFRGRQNYKWLLKNEHLVRDYIFMQIIVQNEIYKELDIRSAYLIDPDSFFKWLKKLHKLSAYKGDGGILHKDYKIPRRSYSKVLVNSVKILAKKYKDPYLTNKSGPVLTNIPEPGNPLAKKVSKTIIEHYYPNKKYYKYYIHEMYVRYKEIIVTITKNSSKRKIIKAISKFYQVSLNSHLFQEVNNSLYMNIVNALLEKIGLHPIEHGIVDFVAMSFQPNNFEKYFIHEVKRINIKKI